MEVETHQDRARNDQNSPTLKHPFTTHLKMLKMSVVDNPGRRIREQQLLLVDFEQPSFRIKCTSDRDVVNGGSGLVVVRVPGSTSASVAPGTNSLATLPAPAGGCKVASFTVSGTLTIS